MARGPTKAELQSQLDAARAEIEQLNVSVSLYIKQAGDAVGFGAEQRRRRLELEEEMAASNEAFLHRDPPIICYVERKVSRPMPPKEVRGPVKYIDRDRFVDREVERIVEVPVTRPAGLFGRIGDKIDRFVGSLNDRRNREPR